MADDWIKMRVNLATDPAVISVARDTDLEEDLVVGKLHRLWAWADQQTRDGNAPGVTEKWIDRYLGVTGIARALVVAGWLIVSEAGIKIPSFDRHNGKSGKQRAVTAKRVGQHRATKCNGVIVTESLPEENETRTERPTDVPPFSESRRDVRDGDKEIDWEQAIETAKKLNSTIKVHSANDRSLLLKASALAQGVIPQAWLWEALESVQVNKARKPAAYFTSCLKNLAKANKIDLRHLLASVKVPPDVMNRKPGAATNGTP